MKNFKVKIETTRKDCPYRYVMRYERKVYCSDKGNLNDQGLYKHCTEKDCKRKG